MPKHSIMSFIKKIDRPVFTTRELSALSGKSSSTVIQSLNYLCDQGLMLKIYRGI
ncbi:type IV toxin-antitoxin system AbiEi family antitoxin domain-containing protein, partial [bacterium]|nr:type IV toxin-antitoxin system AbiEi family antitoxin domain-containing protein [bacterium]